MNKSKNDILVIVVSIVLCDWCLMFLLFKIMKLMLSKGHEQDALKLMSTYLPKDGSGGSAYQEGGGLFALGTM